MSLRAGDLQQQLRDTTEAAASRRRAASRDGPAAGRGANGRLTELMAAAGPAARRERAAIGRRICEQMRAAGAGQRDQRAGKPGWPPPRPSAIAATLAGPSWIGRSTALADDLTRQLRATGRWPSPQHDQRQQALDELRRRSSPVAAPARPRPAASWPTCASGTAAPRERAAVLEELDRRQEGLSAGVKEVLAAARENTPGPFRHVRGLVADLFSVSVETAPLVEVALGEAAQHVVAAAIGTNCSTTLQPRSKASSAGRVGFVWLDVLAGARPAASRST